MLSFIFPPPLEFLKHGMSGTDGVSYGPLYLKPLALVNREGAWYESKNQVRPYDVAVGLIFPGSSSNEKAAAEML